MKKTKKGYKMVFKNIYYAAILKSAKLFGFLHHQALLIYK